MPQLSLPELKECDICIASKLFFVPETSKQRNPHPDNHNIRPKIRQQLQLLRDRNIIEFLGNGVYRKI